MPARLPLLLSSVSQAQRPGTHYDESKVPDYTLPDPLVMSDGGKVSDARTWRQKRRPEILELFRSRMYGRSPAAPKDMIFKVTSVDDEALDGRAVRKEVSVRIASKPKWPGMDILMYLPAKVKGPVPLFVGLNFYGNHTIQPDPGIALNKNWMRANSKMGIVDNRATETSRGKSASRWPVADIVGRGSAWPRSTAAISTPISTTNFKTACTHSSRSRAYETGRR